MDPNEKVLVNYRIPAGLKLKFDVAARKHGKSATGFVQELMENAVFTDSQFWNALMELAQKHQWIVEQAQLKESQRNIE